MTNTSVIEKAESDIRIKESEIAELRQFIAVYKRLQRSVLNTTQIDSPTPATQEILNLPIERPLNGKSQASRKIALDLYSQRKEPIKTHEILNIMEGMGLGINGDFKTSVIAGYLKDGNKLKNIRGQGWVPIDYGEAD